MIRPQFLFGLKEGFTTIEAQNQLRLPYTLLMKIYATMSPK